MDCINNWNRCFNSTNMFSVSDDGEFTIYSDENILYLERWIQNINSPQRITPLLNQMDYEITFVNADFKRDFVVSGDSYGYLMIQKISRNVILFKKTNIFNINDRLISSSILNHYLSVGDRNNNIGLIDLKTFTRNTQLIFKCDFQLVTSLNIIESNTDVYMIVSGMSKCHILIFRLYLYTFLFISIFIHTLIYFFFG